MIGWGLFCPSPYDAMASRLYVVVATNLENAPAHASTSSSVRPFGKSSIIFTAMPVRTAISACYKTKGPDHEIGANAFPPLSVSSLSHLVCLGRWCLRWRAPGPPLFSSMKPTPAASRARLAICEINARSAEIISDGERAHSLANRRAEDTIIFARARSSIVANEKSSFRKDN